MILDPGFDLTLRPMKYPVFYEQYKAAIKNTWTVEEVDFSTDLSRSAAADDARGAAPDQSAGGVFRHRRFDRGKQSGAESLQAHQFARGADVLVAAVV